jgi:hypothetical protein
MKPHLFTDLARRRLRSLPPGPPPAELQQAHADFFEALISRNHRAAHAAHAVIARYARPEPPLSVAERAKRDQRTKALLKWVCALRELREEEARGVVRPSPVTIARGRSSKQSWLELAFGLTLRARERTSLSCRREPSRA